MSLAFFRKHKLYIFAGLLVVVFVLLRTTITSADFQLPNRFQDFITLSVSVFVEAFPFLVLGSLLAAAVNTFVSPHTFERILPKNAVARRAVLSVMGFMFPVCECGNVPLSRSLMIQGLKPSEAITFLLAAPVLNPITIWSTWAAFSYDGSIVVSRITATFLIANIIGFLLSLRKNENDFLTKDFQATCKAVDAKKSHKKSSISQLSNFASNFTHESFGLVKMLAFGALLAGLIQTAVPREILLNIGSDVVLSIVAMLLLAFLVSICATVDAFFALSFANTFTAGSIVSFLVFGPMIDIKMLALLKPTFTAKTLVLISGLVLLMSALTGLVVNYAF